LGVSSHAALYLVGMITMSDWLQGQLTMLLMLLRQYRPDDATSRDESDRKEQRTAQPAFRLQDGKLK
jgi:hypothetical protein